MDGSRKEYLWSVSGRVRHSRMQSLGRSSDCGRSIQGFRPKDSGLTKPHHPSHPRTKQRSRRSPNAALSPQTAARNPYEFRRTPPVRLPPPVGVALPPSPVASSLATSALSGHGGSRRLHQEEILRYELTERGSYGPPGRFPVTSSINDKGNTRKNTLEHRRHDSVQPSFIAQSRGLAN